MHGVLGCAPTIILMQQGHTFYASGMDNLITRWDTCPNRHGDYVEGLLTSETFSAYC